MAPVPSDFNADDLHPGTNVAREFGVDRPPPPMPARPQGPSSPVPTPVRQLGIEPQGPSMPMPTIARTLGLDRVQNAAAIQTNQELAHEGSWARNRDFKQVMQDNVRNAHGDNFERLQNLDPDNHPHLIPLIQNDMRYALESNPEAIGWYDHTLKNAMSVAELMHPELANNAAARFAYKYALAVTSNGLKVDRNLRLADSVYNQWWDAERDRVENRRNWPAAYMPTNIGEGTAARAMNRHLEIFNGLVDNLGYDGAERFLNSQTTVGQLKKANYKISGELANVPVNGSAILGPKIGNGFFQNLNGNFNNLTMDRWFMRSWGRWTGNLLADRPDLVASSSDRLVNAINRFSPKQKSQFEQAAGFELDPTNPEDLSKRIRNAAGDGSVRDIMDSTPRGKEVRLSANNLQKYVDGDIEAPYPRQRQYIRDVMQKVLGHPGTPQMSTADAQALLWFPEKRLYDSAGMPMGQSTPRYVEGETPDYQTSMIRLAKERGLSDDQIAQAIARRTLTSGQGPIR
jgi:hypothetical protein